MEGPDTAVDVLREFNRRRVLTAVRGGAVDRAALGATTGLARSTITVLVRDLLAEGRLVEDAEPVGDARTPGRPARRLRPAPRRELVVAIDFGHSHCDVAVVAADGMFLARRHAELDVDAAPDDALEHAVGAARTLLHDLGADARRAVQGGVGVPAPVDAVSGSVGDGKLLPRWVHRRPAAELAAALGLPFAVDNDANLGALAEVTFGDARGLQDLVYVKAATGIGAGLLLGGRIHHGVRGRAGEIGHIPVDPGGAVCRCGNRGCLETLASTTQVVSAVQPLHEGPLTMADVSRLVAAGDPGASRVVGDAGRMIGRVLADVVNSLSPEQIVLGGELADAEAALLPAVRESVLRFAQPELRDLVIRSSSLGDRAVLLGAAALAFAAVGTGA